ncbi:ATP-binding protein, partial [Candidatus Saccharibacteria bacterium]|nr:ATP-binding protein [Candidatus Saccharibacteria bacterium]
THGYQNQDGKIEIEIELEDDVLRICFRDEAPPFDPTSISGPDLSSPLAIRPVGGMGIHLARQIMDEVTYRLTPNGENELTLIKRGVFNSSEEERC